jgi:hypothetical protein
MNESYSVTRHRAFDLARPAEIAGFREGRRLDETVAKARRICAERA